MPLKITNKVGKLGEDAVCKYLENDGFLIEERNFLKKWGEIDVIASRQGRTHFIEVKSISCENLENTSLYNPLEKIDKKIPKKISGKFEFEFEEIEKIIEERMIEENIKNKIQKIMLSLQKIKGENYLVATIFISMLGMLSVNISLSDKKITSFKKKSFFEILKVKKKTD